MTKIVFSMTLKIFIFKTKCPTKTSITFYVGNDLKNTTKNRTIINS